MVPQKYRGFVHCANRVGLVPGVHAGEQAPQRDRFTVVSTIHAACTCAASEAAFSHMSNLY